MNSLHEKRRQIIEEYIHSYNHFDIEGMSRHLHEDILFENKSNGNVDLSIQGVEAFRNQAEAAVSYFETREQKILDWHQEEDDIKIDIGYTAILAMDFPNGMKKGDTLELTGASTFTFDGDQITRIVDES